MLVDHFGAPGAGSCPFQFSSRSTAAVDSRSSHSAIPRSVSLEKLRAEGAGRLRARSFAGVHVDGQAQHEADRVAPGGDGQQARGGRT